MTPEVKSVLQMAVKTVNENKLYTTRAFEGQQGRAQGAGIRDE